MRRLFVGPVHLGFRRAFLCILTSAGLPIFFCVACPSLVASLRSVLSRSSWELIHGRDEGSAVASWSVLHAVVPFPLNMNSTLADSSEYEESWDS